MKNWFILPLEYMFGNQKAKKIKQTPLKFNRNVNMETEIMYTLENASFTII